MGLDCSHDAFHGAYSAFNRFRQAVAMAIGGSFPPHFEYDTDTYKLHEDGNGMIARNNDLDDSLFYYDNDIVNEEDNPGMFIFLRHSDCDGEIEPEDCIKVADDLEKILPELDKMDTVGHLKRFNTMGDVARQFIAGCRDAASKNESLTFQ